jgi:hypothetical protein
MTETLVVDPSRLKAAGITLRGLVLPGAPPPIYATGTDSVSAAINETVPVVESPVVDGLPVVNAAVTRTGSNIATAAGMYAETDQALGDHVGKVQFLAAGQEQAKRAVADQPVSALADQVLGATAAASVAGEALGTPIPAVPLDLDQVSKATQATQPVSQGMQNIMSSMQQFTGSMGNMGNASAPPAQLASDTTNAEQSDKAQLVDETKKDDEEEKQPEALADGAAPGDQASGSVPVQAPTAGRPETTPSAAEL